MPRNITVTFADGSKHVYRGAPDDVTPEQITQRATQEFGKEISALDGGRKASVDTANLRPADARNARAQGAADLERQIAHLPPEAQAIGRQKFNADPRVNALAQVANRPQPAAPQEHSMLNDLWGATKNAAAGVVQGIASIPDVTAEAIAGGMRLENKVVDNVGGFVMNAFGASPEKVAKYHQAGAAMDSALSKPFTVNRAVEQVAPTPTDTAGKVARFGAQMVGGSLVPIPAATVPTKAPVATAAPAKTAAQEIVQEGKKAGVRVLTSDVKPPATFIGKNAQSIGEKIPFAGTGGVRAGQQAERVDAVKTVLREFGGDDAVKLFDDAPTALDDVAKSLTAQRGKELSRLTTAKTDVIARHSQNGPVPVSNTMAALDAKIAELTQRGTKPALEVAETLKGYRTSMEGKTLDQLEAIRADELSNAFKGTSTLADVKAVGEKALRAIYDPLRKDMGDFIRTKGGDADFAKWKGSNERLSAMMGELDSNVMKSVLRTSEMTPENVGKMLFSKNRSDVARLYANLDEFGKSRAQGAILQRAFDKAVSADGGLSVERFVNNVTALGNSVGVTFKGADKARIEGLVRVLDATRRASAASAAPATGVQNMPVVAGASLGALFGSAALPIAAVGGAFARAYESAAVRNALIRLARTKPGTVQEAAEISKVSKALTAVLGQNAERFIPAMEQSPVRAAARDEEQNAGVEPPQQ